MPIAALPLRRTHRCTARVVVGVAAMVAVAGLVSCGSDGSEGVEGTGDSTTSTAPSPASTASSSTPPTTGTVQVDGSAGPIDGAGTTPVSVPRPDIETAQLTDVSVEQLDGFERVTFTFDGQVPGYDVGFVDLPVSEDGSGAPIELDGAKAISVRMTPASGVRLIDSGFERTYTGPDRLPGAGASVSEVVETGDFESQTTWAIGVVGDPVFRVTPLADPSRLSIDIGAGPG